MQNAKENGVQNIALQLQGKCKYKQKVQGLQWGRSGEQEYILDEGSVQESRDSRKEAVFLHLVIHAFKRLSLLANGRMKKNEWPGCWTETVSVGKNNISNIEAEQIKLMVGLAQWLSQSQLHGESLADQAVTNDR